MENQGYNKDNLLKEITAKGISPIKSADVLTLLNPDSSTPTEPPAGWA